MNKDNKIYRFSLVVEIKVDKDVTSEDARCKIEKILENVRSGEFRIYCHNDITPSSWKTYPPKYWEQQK